jgi:hypothetical protein
MCLPRYVTRFKRPTIEHSGLVPFVEVPLDPFNTWCSKPNTLFPLLVMQIFLYRRERPL